MKKLIGNLYWTKKGLGYRVSSPALAKKLNVLLVTAVIVVVTAVTVAWAVMI